MSRYAYSLCTIKDGRFLQAMSPEQAYGYNLAHPIWGVYVQVGSAMPRRVLAWTDDGDPLFSTVVSGTGCRTKELPLPRA